MLSAVVAVPVFASAPASGSGAGDGDSMLSQTLTPSDTSLAATHQRYGNAYQRQKTFDKDAQLKTISNSDGPGALGNVQQGGTEGSGPNQVQLAPVQIQAQEDTPASSAGNKPQQNMAGVTYVKYPGISHFGPPRPGDIVYQYQEPFYADAAGQFGSAASAKSSFQNVPPVAGIRATDTSNQAGLLNLACIMADQCMAPSRWVKPAQAAQQAQAQGAADASAQGAEGCFGASLSTAILGLINVANENAASPGTANMAIKTIPQAVYMVQQMFKNVYIPMAILLLLPGAVITQVKSLVGFGILSHSEDEEMSGPSPFTGIFRAIIAIFLIPATQVIVSWSIDIGNSMTFEIVKYIVPADITSWAQQQTFNAPIANAANQLLPPTMNSDTSSAGLASMLNPPTSPNPAVRGKATNGPEQMSQVETQSRMTQFLQAGYNIANFSLAASLSVLVAFQIVMMCYLLLLGPIAAALYAWPSGVGSLFKKVFANWVDGVINLALWRFWWCVVIFSMYTRIQWLKEMGQYAPNTQWEMMMFTAFMVILVYVPFMPFEFHPGEMVSKILEKAEQGGGGGAGGAGGASQGAAAHAGSRGMSRTASGGHGGGTQVAGGSGGQTQVAGIQPEQSSAPSRAPQVQMAAISEPPPSESGFSQPRPSAAPSSGRNNDFGVGMPPMAATRTG